MEEMRINNLNKEMLVKIEKEIETYEPGQVLFNHIGNILSDYFAQTFIDAYNSNPLKFTDLKWILETEK